VWASSHWVVLPTVGELDLDWQDTSECVQFRRSRLNESAERSAMLYLRLLAGIRSDSSVLQCRWSTNMPEFDGTIPEGYSRWTADHGLGCLLAWGQTKSRELTRMGIANSDRRRIASRRLRRGLERKDMPTTSRNRCSLWYRNVC